MKALYVSVNETFEPGRTPMSELEKHASYAWRVTRAKADECQLVVAMYKGAPVAAWELLMTYTSDEPWDSTGHRSTKRTGFVLGEPLPLSPELHRNPTLRNGVAVVEV